MPNAITPRSDVPAPVCLHLNLQMFRATVERAGLRHLVRQLARCVDCGTWLVRATEPQLLSAWQLLPGQAARREVG